MPNHNFKLVNLDTDSITFSKQDGSEIPKSEQDELLNEINSLLPEMIKFDHDGYFKKVIILKAKNYILYDGEKLTLKGSGVKASTKEPALKEFIKKTIDAIIFDRNNFIEIYTDCIKEIMDIKDIKRWATRKTLTSKTYESERSNETRILDAVKGTEYVEGDRIWTFFKTPIELKLVEHFDGIYDKNTLLKKLYATSKLFAGVLDTTLIYKNYTLKKNQNELNSIK